MYSICTRIALFLFWAAAYCGLVQAYVGELSKDSREPYLSPVEGRLTAYFRLQGFLTTAKPDAEMPDDVFRAYKLLKDEDFEVLRARSTNWLSELDKHLRLKLSAPDYARISSLKVKVSAAEGGPPVYDPATKTIYISVDYLFDSWISSFTLSEIDSIPAERRTDALLHLGLRTIPSQKIKHAKRAWNAMGATHAAQGRRWEGSIELRHQMFSLAAAGAKGALFLGVLHEMCHVLRVHKAYNEISPKVAFVQENEADRCAGDLLPDKNEFQFNPMGGFSALMPRGFDQDGRPIRSTTHPPAICRIFSFGEAMGRIGKIALNRKVLEEMIFGQLASIGSSDEEMQQARIFIKEQCGLE
jgi:hypothetical protein